MFARGGRSPARAEELCSCPPSLPSCARSIKLDGCGQERDLTLYAALFNATGKSVMIENCHWGGVSGWCAPALRERTPRASADTDDRAPPHPARKTTPNATWCPWNL